MKHEKYGVFYLLPSIIQHDNEFDFQKEFVCNLVKAKWRSGNKILIACDNKYQADEMDEALWKFDLNSFLPHGLFNRSANYHIPIIIYWAQCHYYHIPRDILINLMHNKQMDFIINFNKIIDFVSTQDILKKWARIRYKFYKNVGFRLRVIDTFDIRNQLK